MKKILLIIFAALAIPVLVLAQDGKKKAIYFYSESCVHCKKVDEYFQKNGIYDKYDIQKIEVSGPYNSDFLNSFFETFDVPEKDRGIPAIFFDKKAIVGDQPIIDGFVEEIGKVGAAEFPDPKKIESMAEEKDAALGPKDLSLFILVWAALVDAINPCAFAVLILLVATVASSKGKRESLLSGLLFSFSIFISYLMMGFGIYKAVGLFNLPQLFSIAIGVLAILIGLANLKDFFWYGKVFVMEVPFSWRPKMQSLIKGVTSPLGALGVGFLVSIFLLPCTSGPYLVILGLLAQKEDLARTIPLLILYNLIFITPMVIITLGMYFGIRARRLEEWRQKNIRLLHLIGGAIMLFIGIYLVYSWS